MRNRPSKRIAFFLNKGNNATRFNGIARFFIRFRESRLAFSYFASYCLWIWGIRLISLTLLAYYLRSSNSGISEMGEMSHANNLTTLSLGVFFYVYLLKKMNPFSSLTFSEIFTSFRFEHRFLPGFFRGVTLSLGLVLLFLLCGFYQYFGYIIHFDEALGDLVRVFCRVLLLVIFVYLEEFIFRRKILNRIKKDFSDFWAIFLTSLLYCGVKIYQFDLGVMSLMSLFLVSLYLGLRSLEDEDFSSGAGLFCGLLIVFQVLLSLPVLGHEFQGIVLVKYHFASVVSLQGISPEAARLISGGAGGPLSSFVFQGIFALGILKRVIK